MARTLNHEQHAARRMAILDVARRLVQTQGYEQMSIQDILDELQISKGAFYHYFASKPALLETLIERMLDEAEAVAHPLVYDPTLPALDKLCDVFDTLGRWKTAQKAFVLAVWRTWYTDENALVRQKVRAHTFARIGPLLTVIIRQGINEGSLSTPYPEQGGRLALAVLHDLSDYLAEVLLDFEVAPEDVPRVQSAVAAYNDALERVLGAPPGSLVLLDSDTLLEWVDSAKAYA